MGYTIQNLFFMIGHVEKVGFGVTDPLQDVQDSFPVRDVQSVARFVHDQEHRRLDHGPSQEDHPLLPIRKMVKRLSGDILDTEKLNPLIDDLLLGRGWILIQSDGIIKS